MANRFASSTPLSARASITSFALAILTATGAMAQSSQVGVPPDSDLAIPSVMIDRLLDQKLESESQTPVGQSNDAEFCRRLWLDLAGVAPPVWELRSFLADESDDKRSRLIDRLLHSPRFADHMATRYTHSLLPGDVESVPQPDVEALQRWLRQAFLENKPYDHLVGAFLTAGGGTDTGPAIFYTSREADPIKVASATSRLFLGIGIDCAQCHDHPFADWNQNDFWSFAAFFSQLELGENAMPNNRVVEDRVGKELTLMDTDQIIQPRYLGSDEPPEPDPENLRRRQLTIWLASRSNPYFATAAVNRVWAHLFGRGLVNPIDEIDSIEHASHPQLLRYLSAYLIEERFDLRKVYRAIANTRAYQRTSRFDGLRPPQNSYAIMHPKTLSPEQCFDSLRQNIIRRLDPVLSETGMVDLQRQRFVQRMRDRGATPMDYPHGVVQVLGMINGPEMMLATTDSSSGIIAAIEAPFLDDRQRIEALFLASLSRPPTEAESKRFLDYLTDDSINASKPQRWGDLIWVLANSAESFVCP
ncbi:DUF1549 domain-containing protein [Roseiconus lacunae]|uniref:DUF1549 domain-containing protein n=1 Tax=Roseiconus lacunae TaxID=2605694 RepID=UPI001E2EECFA|nr:DUF1549 domain-containing protein [Roseiconus lacunae]MCD0459709.1 DUF1549 and DUF1553 domain-containing protein [Roseiconus lacunae]